MDIRQYHGDSPAWRDTGRGKQGALIGVELEVHHKKHRQNAADALDTFDPGKYPMPIAERDGSLDPEHGVEIICPPLPVEEVKKEDGYIGKLMARLKDAGTNAAPPAGYGMHVNVNMEDWTDTEKLMTQFCLNAFNIIGQAIGGRAGAGAGQFGRFLPVFKFNLSNDGDGKIVINTHHGNKYVAAYIRGTPERRAQGTVDGRVIEVRFPKCTLDISVLHRTVDYVYAVRNWIKAAPLHTVAAAFACTVCNRLPVLEHNFICWLETKQPELYNYLKESGIWGDSPTGGGKRLAIALKLIKTHNVDLTRAGFCYGDDEDTSSKEQAERICALLGKSSRLQGQSNRNTGLVKASTLRAAR